MAKESLYSTVGEICFQKQVAYYCRSRVLMACLVSGTLEREAFTWALLTGSPEGSSLSRDSGACCRASTRRRGGKRMAKGQTVGRGRKRLQQRSPGVREGPKFTHCSDLQSHKSQDQMHELGTSPNSFLEKVRLSQQKQPRQEERFLLLWQNCHGPGGSQAKTSSGSLSRRASRR